MGKLMLELITNSCVVFFLVIFFYFWFSTSVVRRFVSACYSSLDVCYFCEIALHKTSTHTHARTQTYQKNGINGEQAACVC